MLGQYRDVTKEPRPVGVEEDIHGELEPIPEDGIVVDDDDDEMPPGLTEEKLQKLKHQLQDANRKEQAAQQREQMLNRMFEEE